MDDRKINSPERIAIEFVEAWNRRDAAGIASLFDDHADFVNVAGLWWHDRLAIERAHSYGLSTIFENSTLRLTIYRVRYVTDNVALVHARMRLTGQSPVDDIVSPGPRTTVFLFVAHKSENGSWSCAAAQNTDIVHGMETNVVDDFGNVRPADYRNRDNNNPDVIEQVGTGSFPASDPPSWTGTTAS